ncbi:MAG: hypothetical protein KAR11_01140 [Phycisphaerae bacterium]|nr:hypothetical protein [Phycisphaerae bacterium]
MAGEAITPNENDDGTIPIVPLDPLEERKRAELKKELAELKRPLIDAAGESYVIPLEHREDLSAADFEHFVVNYCLDMYRAHPEKTYGYVKTMRKHLDFSREALANFRSGKTTEPALQKIPAKKLKQLFDKLTGQLE